MSPYIEGSKCNPAVREAIKNETAQRFRAYAAIIKDPETPAVGLEVITNDARAVPYSEQLMRSFSIPGQVVVRP